MEYTKRSFYGAAVAAAMALALAACGGGGGGSSPLPSNGGGSTTPTSPQMGQAQMRILIPTSTKPSSRRGAYVSSSTQSMTIAQNGKQIGEADLTASSPSCAAGVGGSRTCTATFTAPVGANQLFEVAMWDQTGGKGNKLSTGNVTATIQAGSVAQVPVTLDGIPASASVALGVGQLQVGQSGTTTVTVMALDSANNIIVGPGGYSTPVTLAITGDKYATLSLSSTSVTSPGQTVTLSYNGGTNTGATITPSIGGTSLSAGAASFAGKGGAINYIAPTLVASGATSGYPYSIVALPNGSAAFLYGDSYTCCPQQYYSAIGTTTTSGSQAYYVGDTSDPYNPGTATSHYAAAPGVTVVPGMSVALNVYAMLSTSCCTAVQQHGLAADASGNVYYPGTFTSTAASNGCGGGGGTLVSGTIGKLNPTAHTTTEKVLKGIAQSLRTDSAGNVWFIERTGTCNGANLLSSGFGIGELTASGTLHETDLGAAGLSGTGPSAMALSPDGSQMYIADYNNSKIWKIATATLSSPTSASLTNTNDPLGMAVGSDGTLFWTADGSSNVDNYYYGFILGSKTFETANVNEALFPVPYAYSWDVTYADGSFWYGNDEGGFLRVAIGSSGTTQTQFYGPTPYYDAPAGIDADTTRGYVWGADWDYGTVMLLQYGATSNATTTLARTTGMMRSVRNPSLHKR